ncbi:MAG: hypothetical protein ACJAR1_001608 [Rubritalea sp.]|jgi:hypothetical protein
MTKRQFITAKFLKKIGIHRRQKRLQDAADEIQLLREAGEILGRHVWTKVKDLGSYEDNFWGINNLLKERSEFSEKIQGIKSKIEGIKQNQETRFIKDNNSEHNVEETYEKQKLVVDKIKSEQANLSDVAANIRRIFDRSEANLKALDSDGTVSVEAIAEKAKIKQLKSKFLELKEKKSLSDKKLLKQTAILMKVADSLQNTRASYINSAASNHEIMGGVNQALSNYRSKIGLLDNEIIAHYNEIGQNISKECYSSEECKKAVKGKFHLCKIMNSLRQSIDFNHEIANT